MKLDTEGTTGQQAYELATWCNETVAAKPTTGALSKSNNARGAWWENDCDKPEALAKPPRAREDMLSFADRLQEEGYEWAGEAGSLLAGERGIEETGSG